MCFDFWVFFIIWVYFNLTAKGLNIRHQLPHGMSIPRKFIVIIIVVIIIITITINTTIIIIFIIIIIITIITIIIKLLFI